MAYLRLVLFTASLMVVATHALPLIVGQDFFPGAIHSPASPSLAFAVPPPPPSVGFLSPPPSFGGRGFPMESLAHREVVATAEEEAKLPANLRNPFYRNPRIGAALAKESWFANGEMQVRNREADKIPRNKIYSILKNAGFV